jgi:hypothetical protein
MSTWSRLDPSGPMILFEGSFEVYSGENFGDFEPYLSAGQNDLFALY